MLAIQALSSAISLSARTAVTRTWQADMSKRKSTRMFPRTERKAARTAQLERAQHITPEQIDLHTIGHYASSPRVMAEVWLGLVGEPDRTEFEDELKQALQRQFKRETGLSLCTDVAESYLEGGV
jgi:hypothetical protein